MTSVAELERQLKMTSPAEKLREKVRDYTNLHREKLRATASDALRIGIGEIKVRVQELENLTEKDVNGLAGRIKRRKHATSDDMFRLSHAFLQDENNIETFSKIPGALQVLVKEFTGKDSERQLCSAECLCNLSLGKAPVCEKISSLAGSYLVTYLHTTESQLIRMCLWIIANILSTGSKGASILIEMELVPILWKLYTDDNPADDHGDFREDAAISLQVISLNSEMLLKKRDREYLLKHIGRKNPTSLASEYYLQIIFHSIFFQTELVATLDSSQQQYLISYSLSNICNSNEFETAAQKLRIIYSIRVLGNLITCHSACYSMLLQQISTNWQTNFTALLNMLFSFQNVYLTQELLWFLSNILNFENSINIPQSNFLEKLRIPKTIKIGTFAIENNGEPMIV